MTPLFYMVFNIQRVITRIQNPRWKRVKIFKPYRVSMKKCAVVLSQFVNSLAPWYCTEIFLYSGWSCHYGSHLSNEICPSLLACLKLEKWSKNCGASFYGQDTLYPLNSILLKPLFLTEIWWTHTFSPSLSLSLSQTISFSQPASTRINQHQPLSTSINPYQPVSIRINPYQRESFQIIPNHSQSTRINPYQPILARINLHQPTSARINPH